MTAIINSRPEQVSSAYLPVIYNLSTSFVGVNGGISAVASNVAGNAVLTITGILKPKRVIRVGGLITIENTDNYDGQYTVLAVTNSGSVTIDTDFISNDSGSFEYSRLNAQVICDLYINGSFIVRRSRFPNINNEAVFDFSNECQINLGNDLEPLTMGNNPPVISAESSASIYIEYVDAYDDIVNGVPQTVLSLNNSGELRTDVANPRTVVNSTVPYLEWSLGSTRSDIKDKNQDLSPFLVGFTSGARFLTNSPTTINIGRNDSYQLSCIIDYDPAILYQRSIKGFDSTGTPITGLDQAFTPSADSVWVMPAGTRDVLPVLVNPSVVSYTVVITDGNDSNAEISEKFTFDIDDDCHQSKTRFCWLNPRGGYDAYNFYSPRKLNSSVSKESFKKSLSHPITVGDREDSIVNVTSSDSITTKTAKISSDDAEWLQELLESPEVFIELDEENALHDKRIPVTLINKQRAISDSYNATHTISLRYKLGFSKTHIRVK